MRIILIAILFFSFAYSQKFQEFGKYGRFVSSDTTLTVVTPPETDPPALATLNVDSVNYDSASVKVTGLTAETGALMMVRYSFTVCPADTGAGNLLYDWKTYDNDTTVVWIAMLQDSTVYFSWFGKDSLHNVTAAVLDTALIAHTPASPDATAPNAGDLTITFDGVFGADLAFTWGDSADATTLEIYGSDNSRVDSVLLLETTDTSTVTHSFNFGLSIPWSPPDSFFVWSYIYDEGDNRSTVKIDTMLNQSYFTIFADSSDTNYVAIEAVKVFRNTSDSTLAGSDSTIVYLAEDFELESVADDTIKFYIPDTLGAGFAWYSVRLRIGSIWQLDISPWESYANDQSPPDSATTFIVNGDGLGKDTLQTIIKDYVGGGASKDSAYMFYKIGSAASDLTDSTAMLGVKFAVADSATHDTIGYTIDWADDYTIYAYLVQSDSLGNIQTVATANHTTATVDSTGTGGGGSHVDYGFPDNSPTCPPDSVVSQYSNSIDLTLLYRVTANANGTADSMSIYITQTGFTPTAFQLVLYNGTNPVGYADITGWSVGWNTYALTVEDGESLSYSASDQLNFGVSVDASGNWFVGLEDPSTGPSVWYETSYKPDPLSPTENANAELGVVLHCTE